MMKSQEDWDQREHPRSENISKSRTIRTTRNKLRFWLENSPSEEPGKLPAERRDKRPQKSKESSPNPD